MPFKSLFLSGSPDANPKKDRAFVKTELSEVEVVLVKHSNFSEILDICKDFATRGGNAIILCPGFTHEQVAEIAKTVGKDVSVNVARGDGKSSLAARKAMEKAGWFDRKEEDSR
ncbi:MAG: DUF6506 family protein [Thermotogota bacterium]|nr:DUF6506 family protein [Thermotogota bacterium]